MTKRELNNKHAYLIMAHNNEDILEKIIKLIDDENNDIYLHIDKKFKDFNSKHFNNITEHSKIVMVKRMDIRWGDYSQIKCELELLKEATKSEHKYYHLISGADIPIKSQKEIHKFFDKQDKEFIHFRNHKSLGDRMERINYYHLFFKNARSNSKVKMFLARKVHSFFLKMQKKIGINRIKNPELYRDGANWFSITHDLAKYIVSLEAKIAKEYKHTCCADEVFLQSLVYQSAFYNRLYSFKDDDYDGIKRLIDWNRGEPYSYTINDYEEIINSNRFFVRKVQDKQLVEKIYNKIKSE